MTTPANIIYVGHGEQALRSLALANSIRLARVRLKRELATLPYEHGLELLADTLDVMPPEAVNWTVMDVLMSFHRMGRTRSRRLLATFPLFESKTLGTLTPRQQRVLIGALRETLLPESRTVA